MTSPAIPPAATPLPPLPAHPEGLPWPTAGWPRGTVPEAAGLDVLLDEAFDPASPMRETQAVAVVHRGRLVAERHDGALPFFDRPPEPVLPGTRLLSWSMAKSVLHALVGTLVADDTLTLDEPIGLPAWSHPGDPRAGATLRHLLLMRDGTDFREDYVDEHGSDAIEMLFGAGASDVAAFAASRPAAAGPGAVFRYSSGSSNIVSGVVARALGPGDGYRRELAARLLRPLGMAGAVPGFDAAGTWVASSFLHATAAEFARFGYLYLRDGVWEGRRLLPAGWVDFARTPSGTDADGAVYGAHWWIGDDEYGTFQALGYAGQSISVVPALDLVLVRLGNTPNDSQEGRDALVAWRRAVIAAFA